MGYDVLSFFRSFAVGCLIVAALLTGCAPSEETTATHRPKDTLVLATTLGSAPYAYRDEKTGELLGIDLEITRAAAARLDRRLIIREMDFPELLPAIKRGEVDFAAAAITITPSRARDVDFSEAYACDGSAFLYRTGERMPTIPTGPTLRIGTQTASISQFYLCSHNIDPICYPEYDDAVAEFKLGHLDAVFYDAEPIRFSVANSNGALSMTELETRENYGIAVRKGDGELLAVVNAVIRARKEAK